jgi:hypothetical protein
LKLSLLRMHRGSVGSGNSLYHPHEDASLGAVALGLDGDEADEGFQGAVGASDRVASDFAVARESVETLEGAGENFIKLFSSSRIWGRGVNYLMSVSWLTG